MNIIQNKDLAYDYAQFIEALNTKFEFNNVEEFENDFLNFLGKLNNKALDLAEVENDFFQIIKNHTSKDLTAIAKGAKNEMEGLNGN